MLKTSCKLLAVGVLIVLAMFAVRAFAVTAEIFMYGAIFGCAVTIGIQLVFRYGKGPLPSRWWSGENKQR